MERLSLRSKNKEMPLNKFKLWLSPSSKGAFYSQYHSTNLLLLYQNDKFDNSEEY